MTLFQQKSLISGGQAARGRNTAQLDQRATVASIESHGKPNLLSIIYHVYKIQKKNISDLEVVVVRNNSFLLRLGEYSLELHDISHLYQYRSVIVSHSNAVLTENSHK